MFEEQVDNDQELQEIQEEPFDEDDSVSDEDAQNYSQERAKQKDEIRNLRTQLMTIREKLADKTAKIEVIKDTLQESVGVTDFERALEQVQLDEREDLNSDDDDDYYNQEGQADGAGQQKEETDPQILKLQDKVRLLRHRCVGSIGNSIYEQALDYLQT